MNLNACIEREEPRLGDGRDLRSILHFKKDERRSLTVAVGKINSLRLRIRQNRLDGGAELAGLRGSVAGLNGMLTFSKNRMLCLPDDSVLGFAPRHLTLRDRGSRMEL